MFPLKPAIFAFEPMILPPGHWDEQDQRSKGPGPRYPPDGKSPSLVWFTGKFTGKPWKTHCFLHGKNHGKNNHGFR